MKCLSCLLMLLISGCSFFSSQESFFRYYAKTENAVEWGKNDYRFIVYERDSFYGLYADLSREFLTENAQRLGEEARKFRACAPLSQDEYTRFKEDMMAFKLADALNNKDQKGVDVDYIISANISSNRAFEHFEKKLQLKKSYEYLLPVD